MTKWQNRMFHGYFYGKALPAKYSRKPAVTICHDSSHSSHVLSTGFTSREVLSRVTRENSFDLQFVLSLHTLSHTQHIQRNPTYNTWYIGLNRITIKFGTELKSTQISCKSQLYNLPLWLFREKTPKTDSRLKREFENSGKVHSHLI